MSEKIFVFDPEPADGHYNDYSQSQDFDRSDLLLLGQPVKRNRNDGKGNPTLSASLPNLIGNVPNLAARLCEEANDGQILVSQRTFSALTPLMECQPLGELRLKGFHRPMQVYEIVKRRVQTNDEGI